MQIISIDKISINREGRQRRELRNLNELAESIRQNAGAMPETGGLIHPIVVTRDLVLVAGERRLTACRDVLGYDSIAVNFVDEESPLILERIELEENIRREDITWQERTRAIAKLHEILKQQTPGWTAAATAKELNISPSSVGEHLAVAKEMANPTVAGAAEFSKARGLVARAAQRAEAKLIEEIKAETTTAVVADPIRIETADFLKWAPAYTGERFNFIHCDFPYGVNLDKSEQAGAAERGAYADSEEVYIELLTAMARNIDRFCAESAHMIFWFSMKHYTMTFDFFKRNTDWKVNPTPLVWMKSCGSGILPDPSRGPRQIYETAFFASRGDRLIVSAKANAYAAPRPDGIHMSEKSEPMLRHFFGMVVDEHTRMLDPTCGSGSALRAIRPMKPAAAVGLELNPDFADKARLALKGLL